MVKLVQIFCVTLFLSITAFSEQMICKENSGRYNVNFNLLSGKGVLRLGHGCHEQNTDIQCKYDVGIWVCHDNDEFRPSKEIMINPDYSSEQGNWKGVFRYLSFSGATPVNLNCEVSRR